MRMLATPVLHACIVATFLLAETNLFGQTTVPSPIEQIRRDLPLKLRAVEQGLHNLVGRCTLIEKTDYDLANEIKIQRAVAKSQDVRGVKLYDIKGVQTIGAMTVDFATTGRYYKCDVKPNQRLITTASTRKVPEPLRTVTSSGPRGSFELRWTESSSSPDLKAFTLEDADPSSRFHNNFGAFLNAIHSPSIGHLAELLNEPTFKMTRVEAVEVEGQTCTRVYFDWVGTVRTSPLNQPNNAKPVRPTKSKAKAPRAVGTFVFDPQLGSALRSWEYSDPDNPTKSVAANLRYEEKVLGGPDATPLPYEIELIADKALRRILTFEQIERKPIPDDQFTLSAYGMPEFDRPVGEVTRSNLGYWLGGVALILLGVAGWLWRRSRAVRVAV